MAIIAKRSNGLLIASFIEERNKFRYRQMIRRFPAFTPNTSSLAKLENRN